ncbi:hypothetical protein R6Q57_010123 [Mikania cordata]
MSQLAQLVGISELAESMIAFSTNNKDTGLFGVYIVDKMEATLLRKTLDDKYSRY